MNLNIDIYHEDPANSVDTKNKFSRGGSGEIRYVFDEWQMHVAEPFTLDSASKIASLKLDNLTGQIYKLGVQVRAQSNVISSKFLDPHYTEPLSLVKLQSNNKDVVVAEYHNRAVFGQTPDTMEHYYEHLANPGSELTEAAVDRQFVYVNLCPPQFVPFNHAGIGGAAGTRQLSSYTAPTIYVTLARVPTDYATVNWYCNSFPNEGNSLSDLAYTSKYLTVVGFAKNEIVIKDGNITRLYSMR